MGSGWVVMLRKCVMTHRYEKKFSSTVQDFGNTKGKWLSCIESVQHNWELCSPVL